MTREELDNMEYNILDLIGFETFFNALVVKLTSDQREELYKDVCRDYDINIHDVI